MRTAPDIPELFQGESALEVNEIPDVPELFQGESAMEVSDKLLPSHWQLLNCLIATVKPRNFPYADFSVWQSHTTDSFPAEPAEQKGPPPPPPHTHPDKLITDVLN